MSDRHNVARSAAPEDGPLMLVNGEWVPAIPEPFYYSLFPWLWKRLTGWRDEYGRPAQLFFGD